MAVDMLVDSTALDAALTATANAIRTKGGTSAQIAFDDETGFAAAIAALPSGGGSLPAGLNAIAYGTFTPAQQITSGNYDISHTLGITPTGAIIWYPPNGSGGDYSETNPITNAYVTTLCIRVYRNEQGKSHTSFISNTAYQNTLRNYPNTILLRVASSGYGTSDNNAYRGITDVTSNKITFTAVSNQCILDTRTYYYIVWG